MWPFSLARRASSGRSASLVVLVAGAFVCGAASAQAGTGPGGCFGPFDQVIAGDDDANPALVGGPGRDRISGLAQDDVLVGLDGDDCLTGEDGSDQLAGGGGVDYMEGGNGDDYLEGGRENDFLGGDDGNDGLYGGDLNDRILGGRGNDRIFGGDGDDRIAGNAGRDLIVGGRGLVSSINGGPGTDYIIDDATNATIDGGPDADYIYAGGLATVRGSGGNDHIRGGKSVDGGSGNDRINVADATATVDRVDCGSGTEDRVFLDLHDIPRNCEHVHRLLYQTA